MRNWMKITCGRMRAAYLLQAITSMMSESGRAGVLEAPPSTTCSHRSPGAVSVEPPFEFFARRSVPAGET
jgi:hypothetical protein